MSSNRSVLETLANILEKDPNNIPVRLQLATLLFEDGRHPEALSHSKAILAYDPVNIDALIMASQSAEETGDAVLAAGYKALLVALQRPKGPETEIVVKHPVKTDSYEDDNDDDDDELIDEFLGVEEGGFWEVERSPIRLSDVAGLDDAPGQIAFAKTFALSGWLSFF